MPKKTATITLGGQDYTIRPFTIGQLERISDLIASDLKGSRFTFALVRMALERADPKPENIEDLELDFDDLRNASSTIMELAGVKQDKVDPQEKPAGELRLFNREA